MDTIADLRPVPELAIIINVQTKYVSSLALLSSLRHIGIPAVMMDCESQDGSFDWFRSLQSAYNFHLVRAPRRPHGAALDWIFQNAAADTILLIDSDIEVLSRGMFDRMRTLLRDERAYGTGCLQQGCWLNTHYGTEYALSSGIGFYASRPWIPFALLRVQPIRAALATGASFMHRLVLNDVPQIPVISRLLWRRFQFLLGRQMRLRVLDAFRSPYEGVKPSYLFLDTGAQIHKVLLQMGFSFGDVGAAVPYWSILHLQGVTRDFLQGRSHDARPATAVESTVLEKLKDYGIAVPEV